MPCAKRASPCLNWIATQHVASWDEPCYLENTTVATVRFYIYGKEICPTTGKLHYQVFEQEMTKKRLRQMKALYGDKIHFEPAAGTVDENITYCSKGGQFKMRGIPSRAGDRNDIHNATAAIDEGATLDQLMADPDHMQVIARHMNFFNAYVTMKRRTAGRVSLAMGMERAILRPWQTSLLQLVDGPVDPRLVHWRYDYGGNVGKSFMGNYLFALRNAVIFTGGKMGDIAFAYDSEPIVIFDLARTQADKIDNVYMAIENFKNGRFFSPKYNSTTKIFTVPHVIVFANFEPNYLALSADRWDAVLVD